MRKRPRIENSGTGKKKKENSETRDRQGLYCGEKGIKGER